MSSPRPFRGPRAAPHPSSPPRCGLAATGVPLSALLLLLALPARAQDTCPEAPEHPGAPLPTRALSERVRCLEAQGRLEEVVPLLQRLAAAPAASVRERAYLHLYRLGQEVALPAEGEVGELTPAPGCPRGLWVDRYAWTESGVEGSGALLFGLVPDVDAGTDVDGEPAPVETGRPDDRVSEVGGALDLLVSSTARQGPAAQVRGEDTQCTVVVADACSGRVAVVCEDRSGLPPSEEDVALPFPLPPERLEVKEFLLP
ncbi:hypothetical protein FGE12_24785 [Aggregicoccus sp. 17bor-14]|uniref:hypothetical protein n=1 Tax=Myxococcaceae TaxID=31 RepID=UPI00129C8337|nr:MULTISPECIES: hypothetical protein [Myxococcaceae]MBF5045646.1 hypothetical protein [Simulacricoccus sp. 17bor-14]MRI91383.1 hypothetical protein [Aggregicoccus sp. 17bor-14]